jgi:amino acid transporter
LVATLSTAAVASGFAGSIGALWSPAASPAARVALLAALFALLGWVNVRGVRQGSGLIELVTVAKLLPLVLFVLIGAFFVRGENLTWSEPPSASALGRAAVQLMFAFAGVESALLPSGEVRDPARTVPRALLIAMLTVTALYVSIQLVAQGTLGAALATASDAPLATAAATFAGAAGATVLLVGASISMLGHVSGMTLATPRALFALGRDGFLPALVASVHSRYRTPHVAITMQCIIAFAIAASGSFGRLFVLATVSALILYLLCCAASWELRRRDVRTEGTPFRIPGGGLVPVLAVLVILWLLSSATLIELGAVGGVLAVASVVYVLTASRRRQLAVERQ